MVGRTGTGEDSGRETVASTGTGVSGTPPSESEMGMGPPSL